MKNLSKILCIIMIFSVGMVSANEASAESLELVLVSSFTDSVLDAAGSTQYSSGKIFIGGNESGRFSSTQRVTIGSNGIPSIAQITIVLFTPVGNNAPESLTLQGTLNLESGNYSGSISSATNAFRALLGQFFYGSTVSKTLTLNW